ncbi:hypothetical protein [Agromyces cerinus]|uniref:Uncharacterized protein n=1 Tax=Agromyces cerinus subsp. cerinus TaxID=232089 RepID=A0A1N6FCP5_9MICO|nr:hypothetical protein [Agromyces cerinus]SIN93071.1 hypothetical protein SAMN05443544_1938 [Agromyces cerinus subsp. cerinus]
MGAGPRIVNDEIAPVRRFRLHRDDRIVMEIVGEPGLLVSTSTTPPPPGAAAVMHPFATASFHSPSFEGRLGVLLREAADLDAFLDAARRIGFVIEEDE